MYEKIKFSNIRGLYLYLNYCFKLFLNFLRVRKDFWFINFKKVNENKEEKRILLFSPSLNLDKPSYITVGIKALINTAKYRGIGVDYIQCINALTICHLGGSPFSTNNSMPCSSCKSVNKRIFNDVNIVKLEKNNINEKNDFNKLNINELRNFKYKGYKLGELVTSSIIWIKRSAEIKDKDAPYYIKMIQDGIELVDYFETIDLSIYSGVLVFNGASFPESILFETCKKRDINVATFEGGLSYKNKYCIEFNYGITAQHNFNFNEKKDSSITNPDEHNLDNLMTKQWVDGVDVKEGYFSDLYEIDTEDKKVISIFGNVSWDTSQYISNSTFDSMFAWLDSLTKVLDEYPNHKFIFRAHPGENRNLKKTYYGLGEWFEENIKEKYDNAICIVANNKTDSYKIINSSDLVLVYNSTIGMESAMLGKKTYVAANTHYSDQPFVNYYDTKKAYLKNLIKDIKNDDFKLEDNLINLSKNYYFQLFNFVSYSLDDLIIKTTDKYIEVDSEKIDEKDYLINSQFNNLLDRFLNKENIQFLN